MDLFSRGQGEKFLVLEVLPSSVESRGGAGARVSGILLAVDEDRHIAPVKIWNRFPVRRLSHLMPPRVALVFHHSLLFTKEIPLELNREKELWSVPLDSLEIENAAAQAIGKSFKDYRREAAQFLGVDEFDATLVNNAVDDFVVDGKPVELLGFPRAKKIKAVLRLQFTPRNLFETLKAAWNASGGFSLIPREEGRLKALRKHSPRVMNLLALEAFPDGGDTATLFVGNPRSQAIARTSLAWSRGLIRGRLREATGTDAWTAEKLYHAYLAGEMSSRALRAVRTVIAPAVKDLQKEIAGSVKTKAVVAIPSGLLPADLKSQADFGALSSELAEKFGFTLIPSEWHLPPHEIFGNLASFMEHYFDKSDHALNQRLQRRVHWLAPTPIEG